MSAPALKPKQGKDETNLDYGLRVAKWKRDERARRRRERDQVETPDAAEAAEPESEEEDDSLRGTISKWFNRTDEELEKQGE